MPARGGHVKTYLVTLNGTTGQGLYETLFPAGTVGDKDDPSFCTMKFQADKANAADAFVGEVGTTVSSSKYGFRLDPTDTAAPATQDLFADSGSLRLSDFEINGANGEKIAIVGIMR